MLSRGISGGQVPWHPQGWDDWLPWRTHWGKGFLDLFGLRAEAKRVNVALALISQPMVVFLDEPTSGLDSKMANEVCAILSLGTVVHWFWLECWVTKLFVEVYDNIWQYDMTYIYIYIWYVWYVWSTPEGIWCYTLKMFAVSIFQMDFKSLSTRSQTQWRFSHFWQLSSTFRHFCCRKELVKDGYTIVATVHSPTSYAFSLFDDLLMLQADFPRWLGGIWWFHVTPSFLHFF